MKGGIHSNSYLAQWKGEEKSIETCIQSYILTDYTLFYVYMRLLMLVLYVS